MNAGTLQLLGLTYGTDKSDGSHSFNGKSYLDVYDNHLAYRKLITKTVLEIGVLRGESIRMWRDYFPNAQIWGLDIDPSACRDNGDRTQVVIGSQINPFALDSVAPGRQFDLIVDDGSHLVDHIIETFNLLWTRIIAGGLYAIEDTGLTYADMSASKTEWPGQKLNPPSTNYDNKRSKLNQLMLGMIELMDSRNGKVESIHFYSNLILIKKT
jgi:trans-aconitate methyltransferase